MKEYALKNILFMSVTADTSHDPMGPCEPVVQLPRNDSLRHAATARLSSVLFCGENARVEAGMVEVAAIVVVVEVAVQTVDDIDPEEPVNMLP